MSVTPPYEKMRGFNTRYNSRGWCIVEIDYFADPAKDERWADSQRRGMLNEQQFRREFLRDWVTAKGKAFYPEFQLARDTYVRPIPALINAPVYRGWDFGYRKPACLFMQYAPTQRRLWCIREVMPENMDTHTFAVLVRYLSGQEDASVLSRWPKAAHWVQHLYASHHNHNDPKKPRPPRPPFFPPDTQYIDYSGPEALKVQPGIVGEDAARTDAEILQSYGIFLNIYTSRLEAREQLVRSLLHITKDGHPGLFIDPACFHLVNGMNGGIAYPEKGTITNPFPNQPRKDGHYEHLHDCLGYTVVNLVPEQMETRPLPSSAMSFGMKELHDPIW